VERDEAAREDLHEPPLTEAWAKLLVAFTSGAVLILEILSLRLVAPYVGMTLETSTAVIGFALAAISVGATVGGRVADRMPPTRVVGPIVVASGVVVWLVGPAVRWTGQLAGGPGAGAVLVVAALAVFPPAAMLSAVTPLVVKMRLGSLVDAGTVVGGLSGVATAGALGATFLTGFVLVAAVPTTIILLFLGASLVIAGAWLSLRFREENGGPAAVVAIVIAAVIGAAAPARCDVETAYHCALVVEDSERRSGRILRLDTLSHSYIDLNDPAHLEFTYVRGIAAIVDTVIPDGTIRALHLGGGAFTFPRYLVATRTDPDNLIFEIDRGVVDLNLTSLDAELGDHTRVRVEDARVGLAGEPPSSRDVVVGDAFAGLSVPWHLTTREAALEVRRVLDPDGIYVMNLIDYPPLGFVRAETRTLMDVFPHVAVVTRKPVLDGTQGGNVLLVASRSELPVAKLDAALDTRVEELRMLAQPEALDDFVGDSKLLTDDFAPVDQLLTAHP